MAGNQEPSRNVIREVQFEEVLHALIEDAEAADNFTAGAEWALACDAELGLRLAPDSSVWFLPMAPIGGRQISLYYAFDAATVYLLFIRPFGD